MSGSRASTSSVPAPRITHRELDVLELVAEGHSTAEIAKELWITEDTVRTHIKRLRVRLGARTRSHAVAIGYREGLLGCGRRDETGGFAV